MKVYPLEPIRALRMRKEDEAQRKLAAARVNEARLEEEVKKAQKALEDYLVWMQKEADRLFQPVLGKLNPIHKVTDITHQISWNRSQQSTYVVAIEEARKKLEKAKEETVACLHAQEEAYKEVWKINQHRDFWMKEEMLREEQSEEADLEEIAATMFAMRDQEE
ncbi:MAG: type III secretion system stalk subunit SctO [Chthoniobacterales bacterium]